MLALSGLLMGMGVAAAETMSLPGEPVNEPAEMSAKEKAKFSVNWMLDRCERYLPMPACHRPTCRRGPVPRMAKSAVGSTHPRHSGGPTGLSRSDGLGHGFGASHGAAWPPIRWRSIRFAITLRPNGTWSAFRPRRSSSVSWRTPVLGTNSFRPTPKSGEDDQSSE